MITRSDRREQTITRSYLRWIVAGAIGAALVVAVTAFSASYQHQYELNIREGQAKWVAGMQPLSVEGLIAATTLTIWFSAVIKRRALTIWPAYAVLLIALAQASLMNLAADHRFHWPWIGPEISIWPAAAFFAAYEMAVWIMRNRPEPQVTVNEGQPASSAPPTPDPEPEDDGAWQRGAATWVPDMADHPEVVRPQFGGLASLNGELVHTCNEGKGPKGGKKTPGCPRCDALLAGTIAPKGGGRR